MDCRILYVVGQLRAGGLERQLCYLLQAMDRERYRPAAAVWRFREDDLYVAHLRQMGVPIYFPPSGVSGAGKLQWIGQLAKQLKPEIIHSYSYYTNFGAWYACLGTNAVAVGSVRSDFTRAIADSGFFLGRFCARWPRVQIFNSFTAAEKAQGFPGPFVPKTTLVVRNGLDLERFATAPLPEGSRLTIVAVGSLMPVKRWDRLLKAVYRLQQNGFNPLVKVAGEGPLRADLETQAQHLGIGHRVDFIGQREDIPTLMAEATMLVHTSDSEGCPNVVMEAMACGRPVVATDVGDTASLVEDGKTGYVVGRADDQTLVERIEWLLKDPALRQEMGEAGRAKAERDFGLNRLVEQTLAAYRIAGWQPAPADISESSTAAA